MIEKSAKQVDCCNQKVVSMNRKTGRVHFALCDTYRHENKVRPCHLKPGVPVASINGAVAAASTRAI
jgi:demethoxyubiquinone hydroxylase (CLK1/Coq7/Cat5 family)